MRFDESVLSNCWFLAGPTACGKSDVGLLLAERLGAEIVSLDSMALYRGMDVGTAKPSPAEQRRIAHHLIDVIDPHEEFSVARYVAAAQSACRDILARRRVPLFVGGTGLYLRSILRGVFAGPTADRTVRRELEDEARSNEPGHLHRRLQEVDPQSAARLHPHDARRLIRALEVYRLTGRPLSERQRQDPLPPERRPPHVYWLAPPRDWLHRRIDRRVDDMMERGLVEEVRRLLQADRPLSRTARQALGYREIIEWIVDGGQWTVDGKEAEGRPTVCCPPSTVQLIKTRTRQFAKRQFTWFRNLEECTSLEMTGAESPAELAERIVAVAEGRDRREPTNER